MATVPTGTSEGVGRSRAPGVRPVGAGRTADRSGDLGARAVPGARRSGPSRFDRGRRGHLIDRNGRCGVAHQEHVGHPRRSETRSCDLADDVDRHPVDTFGVEGPVGVGMGPDGHPDLVRPAAVAVHQHRRRTELVGGEHRQVAGTLHSHEPESHGIPDDLARGQPLGAPTRPHQRWILHLRQKVHPGARRAEEVEGAARHVGQRRLGNPQLHLGRRPVDGAAPGVVLDRHGEVGAVAGDLDQVDVAAFDDHGLRSRADAPDHRGARYDRGGHHGRRRGVMLPRAG